MFNVCIKEPNFDILSTNRHILHQSVHSNVSENLKVIKSRYKLKVQQLSFIGRYSRNRPMSKLKPKRYSITQTNNGILTRRGYESVRKLQQKFIFRPLE